MLIVMAGLPGAGKSSLARPLAERLPAVILDKDVIRAALFPPSEIEYSSKQDDLCMSIMLQAAKYIILKNPARHIILDGRTFSQRYQLEQVRAFAAEMNVPLQVIECICADEIARQRLEGDAAGGRHVARNRNYELYLAVKARQEPIDLPKLVVDTGADLESCVQTALDFIRLAQASGL